MNFEVTGEQGMMVDAVAQLLADTANPARAGELPDAAAARRRWQDLGSLGVFALAAPPTHDGIGSLTDLMLVMEAFGRALALEPFASAGFLSRDLLLACGTLEAEAVLGALIDGSELVAAVPGAAAGRRRDSRLRSIRLAEEWRIDGTDQLAVGAGLADRLLVLAEEDGGETGLYLVSSQAAGVRFEGDRLVDGSWGGRVGFDGALAERIGGIAPAKLARCIDVAVLASCAQALGLMGAAVGLTCEHLKVRAQFGQPLADQQALRHIVADMAVMTELARSYVHLGLSQLEGGSGEQGQVDAIAKAVTSMAITSCERAVQLHGGMGMTDEHRIGHHLKRALVLAVA